MPGEIPAAPAPDNGPAPASSPPAPSNAPPPGAITVLNGKTEREIAAENKLAEESAARKKAEQDSAYAQDELRRLKEAGLAAPAKKKGVMDELADFMAGED